MPTDNDQLRVADDWSELTDLRSAPTDSALFDLLWATLADILGTAAAAALLRRAAKQAAPAHPELAGLAIRREGLGYRYSIPGAWRERVGPSPALHALAAHLRAVLVELTGPVVLQRFDRVPELRVIDIGARGIEVGEPYPTMRGVLSGLRTAREGS